MAKTFGPLLSVDAQGSIAKTLTYSHRKSGKQVRLFNRPHVDPTGQQIERRILNEYATAMWLGMSPADQDTWKEEAKKTDLNISGFHYFLHRALKDPAAILKIVIFWPFVYNIGTQIPNIAIPDFYGTLYNEIAEPIPTRTDHFNLKRRYCYYYSGTNPRTFVVNTKNVPFDRLSKYSWIAFIRPYDLTGARGLIDHGLSLQKGYKILITIDDYVEFFDHYNLDSAKLDTQKITTDWTHIVITYDGSGGDVPIVTGFLNGVSQHITNSFTAPFVSNTNVAFYAGSQTSATRCLAYYSDCVYLNRIITATEAQKLSQYAFNKLTKSQLVL